MSLTLTNDRLQRYVGGQIEIQNPGERYLFRGEIKKITVEGTGDDATLTVELNWMAKGKGYPPGPSGGWVKDDPKPYKASLMIYGVSDIGSNRISLHSAIVGETTVLYPKGGSALKRSEVVGL